MQFSNTNLIIRLSAIAFVILTLSGCLKKIDGVDELNTNIFDRDYAGEQWYIIDNAEQITNDLGEIKTRIYTVIPEENVPALKPSSISVHLEGDGIEVTVVDYFTAPGGDYELIIDLPYTGSGTYCITLGIYIDEEDAAINLFEDCVTI